MENNEPHGLIAQSDQLSVNDNEQLKDAPVNLDDTLFIYFSDKSALDVLKIPYKVISSLIDLREYLTDERVCNILIVPDDDVLKTLINVSKYERIMIVRGVGVLDAPKEGLITPVGNIIDVIDDKKFFELYRQSGDNFQSSDISHDINTNHDLPYREDDDENSDIIANS